MRAVWSASLRMVESASTLMVSGFLVARSLTIISPVWRLIAVTVAAIWRKDPKATFSAWMPAPSPLVLALLSPRTRNWSPVLISGKLLGLASLKRAESREKRDRKSVVEGKSGEDGGRRII